MESLLFFFFIVYEAFETFIMLAAESTIVDITNTFSGCCLQKRHDLVPKKP